MFNELNHQRNSFLLASWPRRVLGPLGAGRGRPSGEWPPSYLSPRWIRTAMASGVDLVAVAAEPFVGSGDFEGWRWSRWSRRRASFDKMPQPLLFHAWPHVSHKQDIPLRLLESRGEGRCTRRDEVGQNLSGTQRKHIQVRHCEPAPLAWQSFGGGESSLCFLQTPSASLSHLCDLCAL